MLRGCAHGELRQRRAWSNSSLPSTARARDCHGGLCYEFRFSARFSTVSSAAFCVWYSSASIVPESFSLSSVKSSSLSAFSSAAFLPAAVIDTAGFTDSPAVVEPVASVPTAPAGLRSRNAAAIPSDSTTPPRIHHLYLLSGSGWLIGSPMPPPGPLFCAACAPPPAAPAPPCWPSRGIEPSP